MRLRRVQEPSSPLRRLRCRNRGRRQVQPDRRRRRIARTPRSWTMRRPDCSGVFCGCWSRWRRLATGRPIRRRARASDRARRIFPVGAGAPARARRVLIIVLEPAMVQRMPDPDHAANEGSPPAAIKPRGARSAAWPRRIGPVGSPAAPRAGRVVVPGTGVDRRCCNDNRERRQTGGAKLDGHLNLAVSSTQFRVEDIAYRCYRNIRETTWPAAGRWPSPSDGSGPGRRHEVAW